ncbi:MAG: hypothetical protein GWN46_05650, partial [Gammaproteobacteria bacterium]|nr:hypothetical protein [Gammaproteobacteria bacterium]
MVVTDDDLNVGLLEIAQAGAASADVEHVAKDIFLFRLSPDQRWLAYTSS